MSVDEIMAAIIKDRVFYETSGGGVTFSGGEPLLHSAILHHVSARCRILNIDTCIDTCLAVPRENIAEIVNDTGLFLVDVKHATNPEVLPDTVFSNLGYLSGKSRIWIRLPVIPGWNDSAEAIVAIINRLFLCKTAIEKVCLLPFHNTAGAKYRYLNRDWKEYEAQELVPDRRMEYYRALFQEAGFNVTIGG